MTLLSACVHAMQKALASMASGEPVDALVDFGTLQTLIGFIYYDVTLNRLEGQTGLRRIKIPSDGASGPASRL